MQFGGHGLVDSVHLQILLIGTCRQRGSWSVAGHNHGKVTGHSLLMLLMLSSPNCLDKDTRFGSLGALHSLKPFLLTNVGTCDHDNSSLIPL